MTNVAQKSIKNRRYIRFKAEPTQFAQIDLQADRPEFVFQHVALIVDEAPMGGCCLIVNEAAKVETGTTCRIKLGPLAPLRSRAVWVKEMESGVVRIGFEFLE